MACQDRRMGAWVSCVEMPDSPYILGTFMGREDKTVVGAEYQNGC